MKIANIVYSSIIAALLFTTSMASADSHSMKLEHQLNAFNDRFNEMIETKDLGGFLTLYSENVLWSAPGARTVAGIAQPRGFFQYLVDSKGQMTHTVDSLFISDDGTQAVMIGTANLLIKSSSTDVEATYIFVLEPTDNSWKIVSDMWNLNEKE